MEYSEFEISGTEFGWLQLMEILDILGRDNSILRADILEHETYLREEVENSSFLILGGAGTIGQAVTREIFFRNPKKLHVVDISENNLAELVRDLRSTGGYIDGEFKTYCLDIGSVSYDLFWRNSGPYDYILNLSAMKHVRSERDPYTLMRMIDVNILNTIKTLAHCRNANVKKYFCVSTDKAANPANLMGATKRIMEMFLRAYSQETNISTARFANVAFSDGSLLNSFRNRLEKNQPIVVPKDVTRYFIAPQEAGEICLMSSILGKNNEIFFPKQSEHVRLINFLEIATKFLKSHNLEPHFCGSEQEARTACKSPTGSDGRWPVYLSDTNTSGEKLYEEFYTDVEVPDVERFLTLGIVENAYEASEADLTEFLDSVENFRSTADKNLILKAFSDLLPNLQHIERGFYLDDKM